MKLIYCFSLIITTAMCNAQTGSGNLKTNADDNTLLWEISGNGLAKPSYLYGTFHLLCNEDVHFSASLKKAISNSTEVYLELDIDDPAVLLSGMKLMNMKDGKKLKDLYSPEAYKRISDYFKDSLHISISLFQGMKPVFLVAFLYPKMMPCDNTMSVEEGIMKLAKENNIAVNGLETMAFQSSLFDSISYEKQADELLNAIDSIQKARGYFSLMLKAYKDQQMNQLEKIINDPEFGIDENQDILLDKRNKNWIVQLKEIMKKGSVFTAVGTGHLTGKNGLIALLRAEGFTVRGLENK